MIRQVLGRSLLHSAAGAAPGLLGAVALTRLPAPLLNATTATNTATFATAAAFLLAAGAAGAWLLEQEASTTRRRSTTSSASGRSLARRATRTDPMATLRTEAVLRRDLEGGTAFPLTFYSWLVTLVGNLPVEVRKWPHTERRPTPSNRGGGRFMRPGGAGE